MNKTARYSLSGIIQVSESLKKLLWKIYYVHSVFLKSKNKKKIYIFCCREKSQTGESAARRAQQLPEHWWWDMQSWSRRGPKCHEGATGSRQFITLCKPQKWGLIVKKCWCNANLIVSPEVSKVKLSVIMLTFCLFCLPGGRCAGWKAGQTAEGGSPADNSRKYWAPREMGSQFRRSVS